MGLLYFFISISILLETVLLSSIYNKESCIKKVASLTEWNLPQCESPSQQEGTPSERMCFEQYSYIDKLSIEPQFLNLARIMAPIATESEEKNLFDSSYFSYETNLENGYKFLFVEMEVWLAQKPSSHHLQSKLPLSVEVSYKKCVSEQDVADETINSSFELQRIEGDSSERGVVLNDQITNESVFYQVFEFRGNFQFACKEFVIKLKSPDSAEGVLMRLFEINLENRLDPLQRTCRYLAGDVNQSRHWNEINICNDSRFYFEPSILTCVIHPKSKLRCSGELAEDANTHSCVTHCAINQFLYILTNSDQDYPVCLDGYQTCDQMLPGCKTCDRHILICFACQENYILNKQSNRCDYHIENEGNSMKQLSRILATDYCKRPVCLECMNQTYCMKCQSPFILVHGVCKLCGRGSEMAVSMTGDVYCRKKIYSSCSNFDEVIGKCLGCFLNVLTLNSNCINSCPNSDEYMSITGTPICVKCSASMANCVSCSTENQCQKCSNGYVLAIGTSPLQNPDVTCISSCPAGYYVDSFNFCAPCGNHCDECSENQSTCIKCATGFEVDKDYKMNFPFNMERCVLINVCPANCISCSEKNFCDTCMSGYVAVGGYCEKCGIGCVSCKSASECDLCADGTKVAKCAPVTCQKGYYLDSSFSCQFCPYKCQTCWDSESCVVCNAGYVLEKSTCVTCPLYCAVCGDQNSCIACFSGFYLDSAGTCITNGMTCSSTEFFKPTDCLPCVGNCQTCSLASHCTTCKDAISPVNGICMKCSNTQYLDQSYACKECPANCSICVDIVGCVQCESGYYYQETTQKCVKFSRCGDGDMVNSQFLYGKLTGKTCDDNNWANGDGCSSTCMIESGYVCEYSSSSKKSTCVLSTSVTPNPNPSQVNSFKLESRVNSDNLNPVIVFRFQQVITRGSLKRMRLRELALSQSERADLTEYIREQMTVSIQDTASNQYSYEITLHDDTKGCDVEFITDSNIVNKSVSIHFSNDFKSANNLTNENETADFPDTRPISESEKSAADAMATTGTAASSTFIASVIPVIIFSNFSFLFNALDLFQMIYYLSFTNIRLPYNIKEFLKVMSNFQVPFSMNFISWFLESNPVENPDVPQVYDDENITGVFLDNVGDNYSQIIILGLVHLLLFGFVKLAAKSQKKLILKAGKFIDQKLQSSWQWGWYLDKYWEMFLSVVVSCMLQFYGISVTNFSSALNLIVLIASIGVVLASPFLFIRVIKQNEEMLEKKEIKDKWGMLYETLKVKDHSKVAPESMVIQSGKAEVNEESNAILPGMSGSQINYQATWSQVPEIEDSKGSSSSSLSSQRFGGLAKYFFVALYLRKIIFGVLIVGLFNAPLIQLIIIDVLNVIVLGFLIYYKPFEKNSHSVKAIFCELMMIVAQSTLKLLISDSETAPESERVQIGWIFVLSCILILFVQMIFVLVNLFVDAHQQIVEWCKKKPTEETNLVEEKESKLVPLPKQISESNGESQQFNNNVNKLRNQPSISDHVTSEKALMNNKQNDVDLESTTNRNNMISNRLSINNLAGARLVENLEGTELQPFQGKSANQSDRRLSKKLTFQKNQANRI